VPRDTQQLITLLDMINGLLTTYTAWIIAMIFVGALASIHEMPSELTRWNVQIIIAPALFLVALGYGFWTNTMMVQADITYKIAQPLERQQRWDIALPVYEYAVKLAPEQDQYYLFLGRAYLESGNKATDRAQQDAIVRKAANNLEQAQKLNPLNPDHSANLARMLQAWSRTAPDLAESQKRVELAAQQFNNALRLNPNMPWLWAEAARFDVAIRKDYDSAQSRIEHAIKSDPELAETYILYAEYWTTRGLEEKDPDKQRGFYLKAIEQYKIAFSVPFKPELPAQLSSLTNLAVIQRNVGDPTGAISTYQTIIAKATKEYNLWEVYRALAEVYWQKGDKSNALDYANRALTFAPAEGKPATMNTMPRAGAGNTMVALPMMLRAKMPQ
jgi:tetratricopeptide (TPR) repeat protein